jgi:hypothetical protein
VGLILPLYLLVFEGEVTLRAEERQWEREEMGRELVDPGSYNLTFLALLTFLPVSF